MATVGAEGIVGLPAFLGTDPAADECDGQVGGDAWRLDAELFRAEVERNEGFRAAISRYLQGLLVQIAQTVACNRLHPVEERTARWLLMTSDRVGSDEFRLPRSSSRRCSASTGRA